MLPPLVPHKSAAMDQQGPFQFLRPGGSKTAEPISQVEKLRLLSPYLLGGYQPVGLLPVTHRGQGLKCPEAAPMDSREGCLPPPIPTVGPPRVLWLKSLLLSFLVVRSRAIHSTSLSLTWLVCKQE